MHLVPTWGGSEYCLFVLQYYTACIEYLHGAAESTARLFYRITLHALVGLTYFTIRTKL